MVSITPKLLLHVLLCFGRIESLTLAKKAGWDRISPLAGGKTSFSCWPKCQWRPRMTVRRLRKWPSHFRLLRNNGPQSSIPVVYVSSHIFYMNMHVCVQLRAMLGHCICLFHLYQQRDPHLNRQNDVDRCIRLLAFLQLLTEVVLPIEPLYWVVYNGT